jgi:hypothetical protein
MRTRLDFYQQEYLIINSIRPDSPLLCRDMEPSLLESLSVLMSHQKAVREFLGCLPSEKQKNGVIILEDNSLLINNFNIHLTDLLEHRPENINTIIIGLVENNISERKEKRKKVYFSPFSRRKRDRLFYRFIDFDSSKENNKNQDRIIAYWLSYEKALEFSSENFLQRRDQDKKTTQSLEQYLFFQNHLISYRELIIPEGSTDLAKDVSNPGQDRDPVLATSHNLGKKNNKIDESIMENYYLADL